MTLTPLFNPYPGLRPFRQDEDHLFFGREEQIMQLQSRLGDHRFVAVVGTSGSGKSSLVRCGLLSQLLGGKLLRAGAAWEFAVVHPGGDPLGLLAESLLEADLYDADAENAREHVLATLSRSHFGLIEAVRQARLAEGTNFLLVVDQFEEIFRFHEAGQLQQEVANEFVSLLLEAASQTELRIYVVLTMRSDFIGDCGQFEGLAEAVNRGEFLIPRLSREQFKRMIEAPAKVAGGGIAPRLLQRLLNDLGHQADQLPCLQHALMRTWTLWSKASGSGDLDLEDYCRVGQMSEALSLHADEVYASFLSERERELCAGLFSALTAQESDQRGVRRPQRLGRLCQILDAPMAELVPIIDAYRRHGVTFLMPPPEFDLSEGTIIDISHESLMRVWKRLRRWVEEESQSARVYRRLAETAALHADGKAGIYHDPDLQIALSWRETVRPNQAWAERYHGGFEQAMRFLDASHATEQVEEEAREAARRRELEQAKKLAQTEQRAAHRLRGLVAGLAVVAIVAVVALIAAMAARRDAQQNAQEALRQREIARSHADDASQNALAEKSAAERADQAAAAAARQAQLAEQARQEARESLYFANVNMAQRATETSGGMGRVEQLLDPWRAIDGETDLRDWEWYYLHSLGQGADHILRSDAVVRTAKYSPDGTRLASAGRGAIKVWDAKNRRHLMSLRSIAPSLVNGVDWSPDGKRLASAEGDSTAKIWDIQTGRLIRTISNHNQFVTSVAWHPDGSQLASSSGDGTAMIFDAQSGERLRTLGGHSGVVVYVSWSPDGERLATCDGGGWGRIWDAKTGDELHSQKISDSIVFEAVWSPDGEQVAFSGADTTVKIWDANLEQLQATLSGHANTVWGIAWNSQGTQLASASFDQSIKLWDVASGEATKTLRGHGGAVYGICFSPDDQYIASASLDNTVRIWDLATEPGMLTLDGHTERVRAVAWSPPGSRLASVGADGTLRIWDESGRQVREISASEHELGLEAVCWSPDGTRIATAGYERTVKVWDAASGEQVLSMALAGGPANSRTGEQLVSVAWSPDGRSLASAGQAITIWNAETGDQVREWSGHAKEIRSVAWSPDGTRLASGSQDGSVRVWDWQTGEEVRSLTGGQYEAIHSIAWSPDGALLACGGGVSGGGAFGSQAFGFVRIWSTESWEEVQTLRGHEQLVWAISFNPDGTRLASASQDATARVWDVQRGLEMLTLDAGQGLRASVFSPDATRLATAGLSSTIRIWDATPGYRRERSAQLLTHLDERVKRGSATLDDFQLRGQILARLGRWDEAAADFQRAAERLGPDAPGWFETTAWVTGPYPDSLSAEYPPEKNTDPLQSIPGVAVDGENMVDDLRWEVAESSLEAGLNLGRHFDHAEYISGYVMTRIYAPAEREAGILLGTDDEARLWLNGDLVYEFEGGRPAALDDDSVPVVLRQGWNSLLAKVINQTGGHGLYLRLADDPVVLVRVYEEAGRWEKALELWSQLVEEDPDNSQLRFARARVYGRLGQQDKAAEDFAHVTQRRPDDAPALFAELAGRDVEAGDLAGAVEWLTEAVTLTPDEAQLLAVRGDLNGRLGRWQSGAADLARVMELDPKDHWHAYKLGPLLVQTGDVEAYRLYCRALLDRFENTQVVPLAERTGKVCLLVPDMDPAVLERAAKLIEHAIDQGQNTGLYAWFQQSKGMMEYRLGDLEGAVEWLQKPGNNATASPYARSAALYFLAMAQHRLGQTEAAIQSLESADQIVAQDLPTLESGDVGTGWHDWLFTHIARREAEKLILSAAGTESNSTGSLK